MIPNIKVVTRILKVVPHWTLIKLMGIKHENIFWTWEFSASTSVLHILAIMSVLDQYLCPPWTVARGNILVKWFIGGMFFLPGTSWWVALTVTSLTEWLSGLLAKRHRSNMSQRIYNNNSCSDHKMPRMGAGEPDQERLKNGGYSHGKSCSFSVPTEQKRSQGDIKCSEELCKATQRSGKLDLDHETKVSWCIWIIQEKLKWFAHTSWWNTGVAVSDSKHIFNLAKNGRKI